MHFVIFKGDGRSIIGGGLGLGLGLELGLELGLGLCVPPQLSILRRPGVIQYEFLRLSFFRHILE